MLSLSPRGPFADWGLRNVGGCLLSWHVFISKSCAISAALFVPEYSISVVQFEMLIKQTKDLDSLTTTYLT